MASIISGYEYDIFISYRQKDNKHDGWVTEFVNQLKGELEATFKEDISIYFDENPHDGLLETHSVDKSLQGKLKCLIFISIISQTYCDSKSFAWQHEFCAFNKLSKEDQFGRDIKLASGNIAGRILTIKIHDLDPEDKALIENEIGGVLRGIEFIYKSAGVNRPLRANEDHPQDNLNKTYYRDQINKVANAVKDIIFALKKHDHKDNIVSNDIIIQESSLSKKPKAKIILGSLSLLILLVLGYFFIPKLFKSSEQLEKTIAVLPFRNLSNDTTQLYFCDGFMEEILTNLQKVKSFTVRSRQSSDQYKDSKKAITTIGNELKANYLVEGSVGREGNNLKIWVQLIDSKADKHVWSNDYTRETKQIFSLQSEIAKDIAAELKTILSTEEKKLIDKIQTKNLEAYNLFLQGRYFWNKRGEANLNKAIKYFEIALGIDTNYAFAYAGLADCYYTRVVNYYHLSASEGFPKAEKLALKAIALDKNIAEPHSTLGCILYFRDMKWEEARKEYLLAIKLNPNYAEAYYQYAQFLNVLRQNEVARVQMNHAIELNPFQSHYYIWSGYLYYNEGKFNESLNEYLKGLEIDPENMSSHLNCFYNYFKLNEDQKALESLQQYFILSFDTLAPKYLTLTKNTFDSSGVTGVLNLLIESDKNSTSPYSFWSSARLYAMLGKKDLALDYLEKAFENPPLEFFRINNEYDFQSLHSEQRFQKIIKKMGLSDYQKSN